MPQHVALYRKYRGKKLSEILGQDHITKTLANAIEQGKISHAYLFTGPKGVGKTSVARILAHEINNLPYTEESQHLDIIEIDAASNRRIDEIRELRDKIHSAPTSAKYKVYIIDEVHMLTKEAFNALLKTLEEPPAHAVFILATTEAHKLPATIVSRTQRHTFKPISENLAKTHLKDIAQKENIDISDGALDLIARSGDGSFRDSISILDQIGSMTSSSITETDVENVLGLAPEKNLTKLTGAIKSQNAKEIVTVLEEFYSEGITPASIADQLSKVMKEQLLDSPDNQTFELLNMLMEVRISRYPKIKLELALIKNSIEKSPVQKVAPAITEEPKIIKADAAPSTPKIAETEKEQSITTTNANLEELDANAWKKITDKIKVTNNSLYAILRMCLGARDGSEVVLKFKYPFHMKQAQVATNRDILASTIKEVLGVPGELSLEFQLDKDLVLKVPDEYEPEIPAITQIVTEDTDIDTETSPEQDIASKVITAFGGGEVIEI